MKAARSQRGGIEDLWYKREDGQRVPSANHGNVTRWRGRYVGADGHEHTRHFSRKIDAQQWLDHETAKLVTGRWVDPKTMQTDCGRLVHNLAGWLPNAEAVNRSHGRSAHSEDHRTVRRAPPGLTSTERYQELVVWSQGCRICAELCVCAARSTGADPV